MSKRWLNPSIAMVEALARNKIGLQSESAIAKRATYFSSEEHRTKASAQARRTAARRLAGELPPHPLSNQKRDTKPELAVSSVLTAMSIRHEPQYPLGPHHFDFFLPDYKLLLEVQGDYWHSLKTSYENDARKSAFIANNHPEFILKQVTETQTKSLNVLTTALEEICGIGIQRESLPHTAECQLIDRLIANSFLSNHHYIGNTRRGALETHGLMVDGKLLGVAIYTLPRRAVYRTLGVRCRDVLELTIIATAPILDTDSVTKFKELSLSLLQNRDELVVVHGELIRWLKKQPQKITSIAGLATICVDCQNKHVISNDSFYRTRKKYGGYVCHSCGIKRAHARGAYRKNGQLSVDV